MRLLLVWPSAEFSTFDVARGIRDGLRASGHEVSDYRLYNRLTCISRGLGELQSPLEHMAEETCLYASEGLPYRAVLNNTRWVLIVNGMGLHPNAVYALRRIGCRVAIWFTEAPYESTDACEFQLARLADVAFVNERTSLEQFQEVMDAADHGGQAHYLRHAYDPARHCLGEPDPDLLSDVVLVGTGFQERQILLEAIDWTGINLAIGGLWPGVEAPSRLAQYVKYPCMSNEDTVRLYWSTKIVLNPHRYHATAESANPRVYEAAACGAFQIADDRPEIGDLFGESIPTYHAGVWWQLAAKIRRYLADDAERQRLATLARERVQQETFTARAQIITDTLAHHDEARKGTLALVS